MDNQLAEAHRSMPPEAKHSIAFFLRISSITLIGLFILASLYTLYFAKIIFIPIVIALILNFLLSPIIRYMKKIWIPEQISSALVIIVFFSIIGFGFYKLSMPASNWINNSTHTLNEISQKMATLLQPFQNSIKNLFKIQAQLENSTQMIGLPESKTVQVVKIKSIPLFNVLIINSGLFFIQLSFVVLLLYFLLASDNFFMRKLIEVIPHLEEKKEAVNIFHEIERKIYNFFVLKMFTSLGLATVISIVMFALHMPAPILWGIAAGILEFFPYIGVIIGTILIFLSAILTFSNLGHILLIPTVFFMICSFVGNYLSPLIIGRSVLLNPVIIFVGMAFWGWIWGITGVILAIPLLSILKITFENIKSLEPLSRFLGE